MVARHRRPKMVRGDCGFGSDAIMRALRGQAQPYLIPCACQSKNVKRHIERLFGSRLAGCRSEAGKTWTTLGSPVGRTNGAWWCCAALPTSFAQDDGTMAPAAAGVHRRLTAAGKRITGYSTPCW